MRLDNGLGQEIWDLYDEKGLATGETSVRGQEIPAGRYHIVVHLCLFNSRGELLIQQRHESKHGWPGLWDVSVGGSAGEGEDASLGMLREAEEELGLKLDPETLRPTLTLWGPDYYDNYFFHFEDLSIDDFVLEEAEVQAVRWVGLEEVLQLSDAGQFLPYNQEFLKWLFEFGNGGVTREFLRA